MVKVNLLIDDLIKTIAENIVKDVSDLEQIILIGIVTRGYPLAIRLSAQIGKISGFNPPVGKLDITLYRDDLESKNNVIKLKETLIPTSIENKIVILVDDVLFHGRSVRAAIDHVLDYGRPSKIKFAALIDRGHRELPICADYIGTIMETTPEDIIKVNLVEIDGKDLIEKNDKKD
ncbi:MAG: hypothetical protein A2Y40_10380 [Candidatus Margulisbacteria bacterium GWF2_35_9]|nr:MAG: hypothetical protein A2Y40_10380 [Candidatus Margulisbacteria bacterium GWF2_35_9]